jgi:putative membrane-bound dehydrogenase-like protein
MRSSKLIYTIAVVSFIVCIIRCRQANTVVDNVGLLVPDELEATLWAESPMLHNPTNMDVDSKGRIWVTEAVDYRNYNNDSTRFLHYAKGDRIVILEDTDQDGRADSSKVFVQEPDLVSPLGIAVIGNKVVVSCSPNLIVYTDEDGDDKPDKKEILLTGFGGKDHDHSLHSVTAGPDGNWYFNVGNAGPHEVTDKSAWTLRSGSLYTGGSPYNQINEGNRKSDDGKIWVGGLALRVNPDGTGLKVLGHNFRNSYEVVTDSYGNLWQNDNDDQVVTCRTSWLMEGGNAGFFSNDGSRYWQADQRPGQDIFTAHWHQDDPGVMPAGDRTGAGSPTGVVVYEGDALGKSYRGILLSADAGRNTIFSYHPAIKNSGYDLGKRSNLITSVKSDNERYVWNDSSQNAQHEKWFRPSDVTIGTEGAIYIADWYDPVVGGHQMKDTIAYGRIYRISPRNKKLVSPKIDLRTIAGQLDALQNPAVNVRNLAFEKIKAQGASAIEPVKKLLATENPYVKARAIWLLSQLGNEGLAATEKMLEDPDELFRATAFRALRQKVADIVPLVRKMVDDPSPFVRRELAIALRDLPRDQKSKLLLQLSRRYDGNDRWYLETLGSAMETDADYFYNLIIHEKSGWENTAVDFAWRLHPVNAIELLYSTAINNNVTLEERKQMLTGLAFVNDKHAAEKMLQVATSNSPELKEDALYWLSFRQTNEWQNYLDWTKLALNTAYERQLSKMKVKRQIILDEKQSDDERKWRTEEMARDAVGGQLLIGLAAENKLPLSLLVTVERNIFNNPNAAVRIQAGKYFRRNGQNKIFSIEEIVKLKTDAGQGQTLFIQRCGSCHQFGDSGKSIGPDLTLIGKKFDRESLLDAIINPDASIVFGYEPWLVNKKDGESIYGFIVAGDKRSIVIKDISGQRHAIPTKDIALKQKQEKSLMPDPVANGLTEEDLANIAEFLLSGKSDRVH